MVSKLETKLRSSLGDKIDLHIVGSRLVAITEPDGRMYAFNYSLAPILSRLFGFATVFFFFGTWAAAQSSRGGRFNDTEFLAFPGGILFIVCFLCWCAVIRNSRIQKVIAKELPKDAIMMN